MKEKVLSIIALFILTSMVMACQTNTTSAVSTAEKEANTVAQPVAPSEPADLADDAPRITLADAKAAFDAGSAVFVDTRSEASFKAEHIKGAINVHADMLEAKITQLPKDKKIIAYCS